MSDKYLNEEDGDGNQLWRVTCIKEQATDYMRLLKKNGMACSKFDHNWNQYNENRSMEAKLNLDLNTS